MFTEHSSQGLAPSSAIASSATTGCDSLLWERSHHIPRPNRTQMKCQGTTQDPALLIGWRRCKNSAQQGRKYCATHPRCCAVRNGARCSAGVVDEGQLCDTCSTARAAKRAPLPPAKAELNAPDAPPSYDAPWNPAPRTSIPWRHIFLLIGLVLGAGCLTFLSWRAGQAIHCSFIQTLAALEAAASRIDAATARLAAAMEGLRSAGVSLAKLAVLASAFLVLVPLAISAFWVLVPLAVSVFGVARRWHASMGALRAASQPPRALASPGVSETHPRLDSPGAPHGGVKSTHPIQASVPRDQDTPAPPLHFQPVREQPLSAAVIDSIEQGAPAPAVPVPSIAADAAEQRSLEIAPKDAAGEQAVVGNADAVCRAPENTPISDGRNQHLDDAILATLLDDMELAYQSATQDPVVGASSSRVAAEPEAAATAAPAPAASRLVPSLDLTPPGTPAKPGRAPSPAPSEGSTQAGEAGIADDGERPRPDPGFSELVSLMRDLVIRIGSLEERVGSALADRDDVRREIQEANDELERRAAEANTALRRIAAEVNEATRLKLEKALGQLEAALQEKVARANKELVDQAAGMSGGRVNKAA
ncbi:hypothetical protein DFJ74DRAFT_657443 [Hyaloraphidium curvatum]|nr:hypothetical protein DFJ74DRAFT_657443 [Hyaloraphidium curvatum]